MNVRLLQISDSALPISGYTHSWGLEAAIARGLVNGPETLERWTAKWLRSCLAPLEGLLAATAHQRMESGETDSLVDLNHLADVSLLPPSLRTASREMGEQLIELGHTWSWSSAGLATLSQMDHWHHPVAFGVLGAIAGANVEETLTAYYHQAALGMIAAGVRAIPVGHTHGQQILAYLHDDIHDLVHETVDRPIETAGAGCPFYEVLCDEQTLLYARMFRS
jgi:urease accessory protein